MNKTTVLEKASQTVDPRVWPNIDDHGREAKNGIAAAACVEGVRFTLIAANKEDLQRTLKHFKLKSGEWRQHLFRPVLIIDNGQVIMPSVPTDNGQLTTDKP